MEFPNRYDDLDPRVVTNLRCTARRLARSEAVPGMVVEDYEQELALDLWRRMPAFDRQRASLPTFADRVFAHRAASLTTPSTRRQAERRSISLDASLDGHGGATISDALVDPDAEHDAADTLALRHDVRRFLATLTPAQRRASEILMQPNVAEAARLAGVHRSTVYEMRDRLRVLATAAGLDIYVAPPRHFTPAAGMCSAMTNASQVAAPCDAQAVRHLTQEELARRWRVSPRSLERWRSEGTGPAYIKLAGRVVYRLCDVERYEAEQRRLAGALA